MEPTIFDYMIIYFLDRTAFANVVQELVNGLL